MNSATSEIRYESHFLSTSDGELLHVKHVFQENAGEPVLMVHGSIENGKIFYTEKGKGLAPFLARQGYDVYVVDLRGRGQSRPSISGKTKHGLSEILGEDLKLYANFVSGRTNGKAQWWFSHSWGGNLFLAFFARNPHDFPVAGMVFFGTKRRISVISPKRIGMIDLSWTLLSKAIIAFKGYLPAKEMKLGADNESKRSHSETNRWVYSKRWIDWHDGFDYAAKLRSLELPPILTITGSKDDVLGHPIDVKRLMEEIGTRSYHFKVIGKDSGHKHDYDHISIVTHKDAPEDHFLLVREWMQKQTTK